MTGLAAWSMATFPHWNFSPASAGLFRLARQANAMPHVVAGNDAESVVLNLVQPESVGKAVLALSSVGTERVDIKHQEGNPVRICPARHATSRRLAAVQQNFRSLEVKPTCIMATTVHLLG